jgi:hypothetical protein
MWWNGRQNWVDRRARRYLSDLLDSKGDEFRPQNAIVSKKDIEQVIGMDYPVRVNNVKHTLYRSEKSLLPWIHTEIRPFINEYYMSLTPRSEKETDKERVEYREYIQSELQSRFKRHPKKANFRIDQSTNHKQSKNQKKPADRKALLIAQVNEGSEDWDLYKELADIYIAEKSFDQAKDLLLKYPGLSPSYHESAIQKSNLAAGAGNLFFERGVIEHAKFFYEISDGLDTGSGWCLMAQENLAILNRDFDAAMGYCLLCAQRYNSSSSYANYMAYLHLQGKHQLAWSMFRSMVTSYSGTPEMWTSALIGHRIEGRSDDEIHAWMSEMAQRAKTDKQKSYVALFGNLSLMDRIPDKKIVNLIQTLNVPVPLNYYKLKMPKVTRTMRSGLPYNAFSKGYESLLKMEYEAAVEAYARMSYRTIDGYLAFAAAKSNPDGRYYRRYLKTNSLRKYPKYSDFNKLLARAVVNCHSNNHNEAIEYLKKAFSVRPPTVDEPYNSIYYLLEICEWLYIDSQESRYLELLLGWCRTFQRITPMYSWVYAIEAKYATDEKNKLRSLGTAQFLDPRSSRLEAFDQGLRNRAKEWFDSNNPFVKKSAETQESRKL